MEQRLDHVVPARTGTGLAALVAGAGSIVPALPERGTDRCGGAFASDIVHLLVQVHGAPDGLVERAGIQGRALGLTAPFAALEAGFAGERALLLALAARAGPQPNTPHHDSANAALAGHARAIDYLARSERAGCALGAALAFVRDWRQVRPLIGAIADRLDLAIQPCGLPDDATLADVEMAILADAALVRGFWFGAEQLLLQQRGFWDLVAARAAARAAVTE